jgi:hypothetical protein
MKKWFAAAALVAALACGATAFADSSASELAPNWHVHDGQLALGPQHKGISIFPRVLGLSTVDYLQDPAQCPNATDKAFLPSADTRQSEELRAGVCMTSTTIIHLRTVPVGTDGPDGWQSLLGPEGGYVTYYLVTAR